MSSTRHPGPWPPLNGHANGRVNGHVNGHANGHTIGHRRDPAPDHDYAPDRNYAHDPSHGAHTDLGGYEAAGIYPQRGSNSARVVEALAALSPEDAGVDIRSTAVPADATRYSLDDDEFDDGPVPIPQSWRQPAVAEAATGLSEQMRAGMVGFGIGLVVIIPAVLYATGQLENVTGGITALLSPSGTFASLGASPERTAAHAEMRSTSSNQARSEAGAPVPTAAVRPAEWAALATTPSNSAPATAIRPASALHNVRTATVVVTATQQPTSDTAPISEQPSPAADPAADVASAAASRSAAAVLEPPPRTTLPKQAAAQITALLSPSTTPPSVTAAATSPSAAPGAKTARQTATSSSLFSLAGTNAGGSPDYDLLAQQARTLIDEGHIIDARRVLEVARGSGRGDLLFMLAETYDPIYLGMLGSTEATPDADAARGLYMLARDAGFANAEARMKMLR